MELLQNSYGVKNIVEKQKQIDEFEQKAIDTRVELELLFRKSSENNKAICELRGIGFLGRLFKKKEIEAELAKLEGMKREFDNDINATVEKIELIEKIVSRLKTELEKHAEELSKVGLTPEDIISEYEIIVKEIAEGKNKKQYSAPQEPVKPKQKITTGTKQTARMSPLDRFNDRMRKYEAIKAQKTEPTEQEKQ